jgi:hypothetical protein
MKSTTVPETGIPLDDLRVEELEPRLEFVLCPFDCCNGYTVNEDGSYDWYDTSMCPGLSS